MTRKILAAFLALCMTMTLTPFAFAANTTDQGETGTNTNGTDINAGGGYSETDIAGNSNDDPPGGVSLLSNNVAKIGETEYATLAEAITAAGNNETTITLIADATENVTIPANVNITLDLGGKTLTNTNAGTATISVVGTATVKNGTVTGGTSYYNIEVKTGGNLTLEGVTATAGNAGSSMIANWGTLAIKSGTYTGGLNTIINEPNANLTIDDGKFELQQGTGDGYTATVFNYGNLIVNGGEFLQSHTRAPYGQAQVIYTDKEKNATSLPSTKIVNGTFTNKASSSTGWAVRETNLAAGCTVITGGTFNRKLTSSYLADGYAVVTISSKYSVFKAATGITLNHQTAEMKVGGEKLQLTATVTPDDVYQTVTWKSSKPTVASVNSKTGEVTAKGAGTATITATAAGGKTATCEVKVTDEVASINGVIYQTFAEARNAAQSGDTIKLLKDVSTNTLEAKGITYDLNGHKMTYSGSSTITYAGETMSFIDTSVSGTERGGTLTFTKSSPSTTAAINPQTGATLNISNINVICRASGFFPQGDSSAVSITNCDVSAKLYCLGTNAAETSNYNVIITLKGSTFTSNASNGDNCPVYINVAGNLNIDDCTLIGGRQGVLVRAGTAKITNSTIKTTGIYKDPTEYYNKDWGGGNEVPAAALIVGSYNSGAANAYLANATVTLENTALIGENDFPALYVDGNTTYAGTVTINGKDTTVSGAVMKGQQTAEGQVNISISDGYFTSDPTSYVVSTKAALPGTYVVNGTTYSYKVDAPLPTDVEVAAGKTEATNPNNVSTDVVNSVSETTVSGVTENANEVANKLPDADKATKEKFNSAAADTNTSIPTTSSSDITTVISPRLDITINSCDSTAKTLDLDITAVYDIKATTADDTAKMVEFNGSNATTVNTVTIQKNAGTLDTTGTDVEITIPLPANFVNDTKTPVYITHTKANGTKYVYKAKVTKSGETYYATFTNPNGFSNFVLKTQVAASITANDKTTYYDTLQDAVDAVQNDETIEILKDGETAMVSGRSVKFTVNPNSHTYTINLGSHCKNNATETDTYDIVYSRPSSGSGSSVTTYAVNVTTATNGTVTADKKTAAKGATVTVTATPSTGYVVDKITVVDKDGKAVDVTAKDGKYSFVMPASAVTVTATFKAETPAPSGLPFVDMKSGDWFYDAVKYAYENGLMNGTSETIFAPNGTMNRAMIVTVLYRLEKTPAVTTASQFADVPAGQWYSDAVAWAAANNIVNGYNETTFGPMNAVTREQMAAILYRYEQYKGMDTVTLEENLARFPDKDKVSAYAVPAMQWAVGQKVINGNADGTLNPTGTATRAQVAQIFTNLLNK